MFRMSWAGVDAGVYLKSSGGEDVERDGGGGGDGGDGGGVCSRGFLQ